MLSDPQSFMESSTPTSSYKKWLKVLGMFAVLVCVGIIALASGPNASTLEFARRVLTEELEELEACPVEKYVNIYDTLSVDCHPMLFKMIHGEGADTIDELENECNCVFEITPELFEAETGLAPDSCYLTQEVPITVSEAWEFCQLDENERRQLCTGTNNCNLYCFDESAIVETKEGAKGLTDISAGDYVQTCSGDFTRVAAVMDHQKRTDMLEFGFQNTTQTLTVTPGHYINVNGNYVAAKDVKLNDIVNERAVTGITSVENRHAMNFVTLQHEIMVNGMCATWLSDGFEGLLAWENAAAILDKTMVQYLPTWYLVFVAQPIANIGVSLADNGYVTYRFLDIVFHVVTALTTVFCAAVVVSGIHFLYPAKMAKALEN